MATQTPNFNFDLRESSDIFNPLSTNANFEILDTILKNLQESGGITTYTTTASANLLKLSGTPKVNNTVFKFVAAGDANTWSSGGGSGTGAVYNIIGLDGKQVTVKGGNMYVAWVNSANAMVCIAWPDVVDAQTFDGKGPAEWATKVQLDAVNTTAGNAVTTAQAATTVANNALEVAQAAGFSPVLLWTNPNPTSKFVNQTLTLDKMPSNCNFILCTMYDYTYSKIKFMGILDANTTDPQNISGDTGASSAIDTCRMVRMFKVNKTAKTIQVLGGYIGNDLNTLPTPVKFYAI